jgi:muramoyltetrapeptide carboxypeptidase
LLYFGAMQRKSFLQSLALGWVPLALPFAAQASGQARRTKVPAYLQAGDTIGITAPAGYALAEDIAPCVDQLKAWGYQVKIGATIGLKDGSFGGSDAQRAQDLQQLLDDPSVKAILCAAGGYGSVRIIDRLDFGRFRQQPKWIIGFSDITVLHAHLHQVVGVASLHGKMCSGFPKDPLTADPLQTATIQALQQAWEGKRLDYTIPVHPQNRLGQARGQLVGGNLKILENLSGSASQLDTRGKILFIEDVNEPLYNIDRMLCNLDRSGLLSPLKGLVVGSFTGIKPETPGNGFGRDLVQIVWERTAAYGYPLCFDFPVGHQRNNMPLKCGLRHQLNVTEQAVELIETP